MTYFFSEETKTRLSDHVVAADGSDIGSILSAIKKNSSNSEAQKDEVILENGTVRTVPKGSADEEKVTKLSDHVVAADGSDIGSILSAIKKNSSNSEAQKDEVILENGTVRTVPKGSADEEKVTKLSDHVVAGYWYNDYPQVYQFEKDSLAEQQRKMGYENFAYSEGKTSDGKLYFVISIRLRIDQVLPNYKVHKFLMVYGHNFNNETSASFGGQALKVYPADPDESYYYRNGEIFHHLLPRDEENRHYMCRALTEAKTNPRDVNAYNSIEEILRWLTIFYIWKASGIDIDK
jgi:hypothetical protein